MNTRHRRDHRAGAPRPARHRHDRSGQPPPPPLAPVTETHGRTSFQTNLAFDPRLHLQTDICIVHRHGARDIAAAIRSWADRGYAVHEQVPERNA